MKLIKKFFYHLKTKGVILTFIKIWEYILYKIKVRKNKFKPVRIMHKNIWLLSNPKGVNLGYKNSDLTVNVGFHTSIKCIHTLHDSTQADWTWETLNSGLLVKQRWWNLPLHQIWRFNLDDNKILWTIILNVENILIVDEIKSGILISPDYKNVDIDHSTLSFPDTNNWEMLGKWENQKHLVLRSISEYPDIKFKVRKTLFPASLLAQNTNDYLNGRLVQIGIFQKVELPAGRYKLAELELELLI